MDKPSLPKGTRDFGPAMMAKRQFIFKTIRTVFEKFGFQPLETPAMENLSTLTGKYGEEGDQLLFKILNSGDFLKKYKQEVLYPVQLRAHFRICLGELFDVARSIYFTPSDHKTAQDAIEEGLQVQMQSKHSDPNYLLFTSFVKNLLQGSRLLQAFVQFTEIERVSDQVIQQEIFAQQEKWRIVDSFGFDIELYLIRFQVERISSRDLVSAKEFKVTEKGLRYDLTVPFARYVVMNRGEILFPFKRYQIQPVWRADNPQKGRYREFYQCDADVVGTNSLLCEAEIILMIKEVFKGLNITDYSIKINHRGILNGVAEVIGAKGNETALFVAIDKLDKIGEENVKAELRAKGFSEESLTLLFNILNVKGSITNKIAFLAAKFETCPPGQQGLLDLKEVFNLLSAYGSDESHVDFDVTLARGLSYYTGCIFEVKINNVSIGSVSGGGRYDNLTQTFGDKENLSGVGFSFGVDRLYDAMEELKIFPKDTQVSSKVLLCHLDEESMKYALGLVSRLRNNNIASEVYPEKVKIKKQLDYANKKMVPFTIVIGSEEMKTGKLAFKNMETGEQSSLSIEEIIQRII